MSWRVLQTTYFALTGADPLGWDGRLRALGAHRAPAHAHLRSV